MALLFLLEHVVYLEGSLEIGIQVVIYCFCPTYLIPISRLLIPHFEDDQGITLGEEICIPQASATYGDFNLLNSFIIDFHRKGSAYLSISFVVK